MLSFTLEYISNTQDNATGTKQQNPAKEDKKALMNTIIIITQCIVSYLKNQFKEIILSW